MSGLPHPPDPDPAFSPDDWPKAVADEIDAMVRRYGVDAEAHDPLMPPIAVFDWDDTSMFGDISHEALHLLEARDPKGRVDAYEAACRADLYKAYRDLVHTLVAGRTVEEVRQLALDALAHGEARGTLRLRTGMKDLVARLQARGWWVRVITASPAPLVQPLAAAYGIPPDHVLGMTSKMERGRYLPELVEPVPIAFGKLEALRAHAGRDPHFTAGDSRSDHALMDVSRYVLLRHKGDDDLHREATERRWWILDPEKS